MTPRGTLYRTGRRWAGAYVLTLSTSLLVAVMGVAALIAVRVERTAAAADEDFVAARLNARSAAEVAALAIASTQTWRTTYPNGAWVTGMPLGEGTYSVSVVDPGDADLADSASDSAIVVAVGEVGPAQYRLAVELAPYGPAGMDCLYSAVHAGGRLYNSGWLRADATASSNSNVSNSGYFYTDVEASGYVDNAGIIDGSITEGAGAKEMPDPDTVFDEYLSRGTEIPRRALPGDDKVEKTILSSTRNDFTGVINAEGIYYIDAERHDIEVKDVRIEGTLVVVNLGSKKVKVKDGIIWEPASDRLPALLVDGELEFDYEPLLREPNVKVNFNPPGYPYQGDEDNDTKDEHASYLAGLFYASGDITVKNTLVLSGVLVAGASLTVEYQLTVEHDARPAITGPPGFERSYRPMGFVPGTWQQVVD